MGGRVEGGEGYTVPCVPLVITHTSQVPGTCFLSRVCFVRGMKGRGDGVIVFT